jgi:hypothetical protein
MVRDNQCKLQAITGSRHKSIIERVL